jgi:hypothetical protein
MSATRAVNGSSAASAIAVETTTSAFDACSPDNPRTGPETAHAWPKSTRLVKAALDAGLLNAPANNATAPTRPPIPSAAAIAIIRNIRSTRTCHRKNPRRAFAVRPAEEGNQALGSIAWDSCYPSASNATGGGPWFATLARLSIHPTHHIYLPGHPENHQPDYEEINSVSGGWWSQTFINFGRI